METGKSGEQEIIVELFEDLEKPVFFMWPEDLISIEKDIIGLRQASFDSSKLGQDQNGFIDFSAGGLLFQLEARDIRSIRVKKGKTLWTNQRHDTGIKPTSLFVS